MGFEYTITLKWDSSEKLDAILRAIPEFSDVQKKFRSYEFRTNANAIGMPDAEARIEKNGLYFCDYGGEGSRILQELLVTLRSVYGEVEAEERD